MHVNIIYEMIWKNTEDQVHVHSYTSICTYVPLKYAISIFVDCSSLNQCACVYFLLLTTPSAPLPFSSFQLEASRQLAERERLAAEAEIFQLRLSPVGGRDSPFDMARSSVILADYKQQLEEANLRVKELESFVIEQVCVHVCLCLCVCMHVCLCVCTCT